MTKIKIEEFELTPKGYHIGGSLYLTKKILEEVITETNEILELSN